MLKRNLLIVVVLFVYGGVAYGSVTSSSTPKPQASFLAYRQAPKDCSPDSTQTQKSAESDSSAENKIFGTPFEMVLDAQDLEFGFFIDLSSDDESINKIKGSQGSSNASRLNAAALSEKEQRSCLQFFAEESSTPVVNASLEIPKLFMQNHNIVSMEVDNAKNQAQQSSSKKRAVNIQRKSQSFSAKNTVKTYNERKLVGVIVTPRPASKRCNSIHDDIDDMSDVSCSDSENTSSKKKVKVNS